MHSLKGGYVSAILAGTLSIETIEVLPSVIRIWPLFDLIRRFAQPFKCVADRSGRHPCDVNELPMSDRAMVVQHHVDELGARREIEELLVLKPELANLTITWV
jgi:hypothetical protein